MDNIVKITMEYLNKWNSTKSGCSVGVQWRRQEEEGRGEGQTKSVFSPSCKSRIESRVQKVRVKLKEKYFYH